MGDLTLRAFHDALGNRLVVRGIDRGRADRGELADGITVAFDGDDLGGLVRLTVDSISYRTGAPGSVAESLVGPTVWSWTRKAADGPPAEAALTVPAAEAAALAAEWQVQHRALRRRKGFAELAAPPRPSLASVPDWLRDLVRTPVPVTARSGTAVGELELGPIAEQLGVTDPAIVEETEDGLRVTFIIRRDPDPLAAMVEGGEPVPFERDGDQYAAEIPGGRMGVAIGLRCM